MKEGSFVYTVKFSDSEFPRLLKEIPNAPKRIFALGRLPPANLPLVAIVGTRQHTKEGRLITEQFTSALTRRGVGIVSGLALGIDGVVHETTLKEGGYTIAVLGSGLEENSIHPVVHVNLAKEIVAKGGCLISEYPPEFKATLYSFPARNRIIAGLTLATLVTEAPEGSGALITAKAALDYNREVLCVPHSINNPRGAGNNKFLKLGAGVAIDWRDVMRAINLPIVDEASPTIKLAMSQNEEIILTALKKLPLPPDDIIKISKLPSNEAMSSLTLLEIKGLIKNNGGVYYNLL